MRTMQHRDLRVIALIVVLCGSSRALGQVSLDCSRFADLNADTLPQGVYLPPLVEDTPYSITNPGRLSEVHRVAVRDLLDRARCVASSRKIPLGSLRITVFAHTDDRGAREHILDELRRRGVAASQLSAVGRSIVDIVAAWHRARVIVEQLREEVSRALRSDPSLGAVDPAGMVQPDDLAGGEPSLAIPVVGASPQTHRRGFIIVVAARTDAPGHLTSGPPPMMGQSPVLLSPTIQVSCCTSCGSGASAVGGLANDGHAAKTAAQPWLGALQLDALVGAAFATDSYTRNFLYRDLAWFAFGVRLPLRRLELSARLSFHGGGGSITYNHIDQDQLRLGAGFGLQLGLLALDHRHLRLALGADFGVVYLFRRIERIDFPYIGVVETGHILAAQAGGWLRFSVPLPALRRLAVSGEFSIGVLPFPTEERNSVNVTAKALGGITYAIR